MNIAVKCACGQKVFFGLDEAGTRRTCPYCEGEIIVPGRRARVGSILGISDPRARPAARPEAVAAGAATAPAEIQPIPAVEIAPIPVPTPAIVIQPTHRWSWRCLVLSLALIPLAISLLSPPTRDDVERRLLQTMSKLSIPQQQEVDRTVSQTPKESRNVDTLIMALPGHRIEGARFTRDSWGHWLYAAMAGVLFFAAAVLLFPSASATSRSLLRIGLFTGTVGIVLLLAFQIAAALTQDVWVRGFGIGTLFFYIVKFIGFSYASALDPQSGLFMSALGFTLGVGFCEETCKLLPLLWRVPLARVVDWRGAYLWGLVSGFGFGISEGITYASGYNGIQTEEIYAVRFISCVALHGIWSGAAAISLYRNEKLLSGARGFESLLRLVHIVFVPMVLHGLYDTLLKKDMRGLALSAALASLAWMTFQVQSMRRQDPSPAVAAVEEPVLDQA